MKPSTRFFAAAGLSAIMALAGCKSSKTLAKETTAPAAKTVAPANVCDQVIRYYADILKSPGGEEIKAPTIIIVNPLTKIISLSSEPSGQQKVSFDTVIETIDCHFNADLASGQSVYRGYIMQLDGKSSAVHLKIEAKDGSLTITSADPDDYQLGLVIPVSKWEFVQQ